MTTPPMVPLELYNSCRLNFPNACFKWAIEHQYDYIFEMDADFSHSPNDLPRLYEACHDEGFDIAIGSRYISGVNVVNWPMGRVLMSYFASKYVRMITGE